MTIQSIFLLTFLVKIYQNVYQSSSYLTQFNFSEISTAQPLSSDYCYGLWNNKKFCLKNELSFVNGFQKFIDTQNERRQQLFDIQIDAIKTIIKDKVNIDTAKDIFGQNSHTLYPLLLDVLILRFKKIYPICYENLNRKVFDIFCYLVTGKQDEYFYEENNQKFVKVSKEYIYEITKNCLETFRGYCIIIKYLRYRAQQLNQQTIFEQIIPKQALDQCDNRLIACISDYSDKDCDEDIKLNMLLYLINSNGLVGENQLQDLINYYLYGQGNIPTKQSFNLIKFQPQQDTNYIELHNPSVTKNLNLQVSFILLLNYISKIIFILFF